MTRFLRWWRRDRLAREVDRLIAKRRKAVKARQERDSITADLRKARNEQLRIGA